MMEVAAFSTHTISLSRICWTPKLGSGNFLQGLETPGPRAYSSSCQNDAAESAGKCWKARIHQCQAVPDLTLPVLNQTTPLSASLHAACPAHARCNEPALQMAGAATAGACKVLTMPPAFVCTPQPWFAASTALCIHTSTPGGTHQKLLTTMRRTVSISQQHCTIDSYPQAANNSTCKKSHPSHCSSLKRFFFKRLQSEFSL